MIISVSRRTDIPAFYSSWFFNRLKEGFVLVPNPMNPNLIRRVSLSVKAADFFVFWTKNPRPMMSDLYRIDDFFDSDPGDMRGNTRPYYFLFTVTPYGKDLERDLPSKEEIIDTFIELSFRIGKERVIWRYDPIVFTDVYDFDAHLEAFDRIGSRFHGFTNRCIISFLDMYKKCERNLAGIPVKNIGIEGRTALVKEFHSIAGNYGIELMSCAEETDYSTLGVKRGECIDAGLIEKITGLTFRASGRKKDKYQRSACGCVESIDIGAYDSCGNHCLYCYANSNFGRVRENISRHDPSSPVLIGNVSRSEDLKVIEVKGERVLEPKRMTQKSLFGD